MTLKQLQYIVTVAEEGNITSAAKRLFISQPSLTSAIHELEKEYNITIFIRSNKGSSRNRKKASNGKGRGHQANTQFERHLRDNAACVERRRPRGILGVDAQQQLTPTQENQNEQRRTYTNISRPTNGAQGSNTGRSHLSRRLPQPPFRHTSPKQGRHPTDRTAETSLTNNEHTPHRPCNRDRRQLL